MSKDGKSFCATRFGDYVIDIGEAEKTGLFEG